MLIWAGLGILATGCSTIQVIPTGRAASDQMLTAITIEEAVEKLDIDSHLRGKRVRLSVTGLGIDQAYTEEILKAKIRSANGTVAEDCTPDLNLQVIVQTAGSDMERSKWGIPLVLPDLRETLAVTQIDLYKNDIQVSRCRLWAYGMDNDQNILFEHPPVYVAHYVSNPELIGISLGKRSDIDDLEKRTQSGLPGENLLRTESK